jgi:hypothetical protein
VYRYREDPYEYPNLKDPTHIKIPDQIISRRKLLFKERQQYEREQERMIEEHHTMFWRKDTPESCKQRKNIKQENDFSLKFNLNSVNLEQAKNNCEIKPSQMNSDINSKKEPIKIIVSGIQF